MELNFLVHSAVINDLPVTVSYQGEEVKATVECLEVELLPVNTKNGSLTVRFTGNDITEARELFIKDKAITAKFSVTS